MGATGALGLSDCDCGVPIETPLPEARGLRMDMHGQPLASQRAASSPPATGSRQAPVKIRVRDAKGKTDPSCGGGDRAIVCSPGPVLSDPTAFQAPVALSVYSLKGASAVNKLTELAGLGGAYHVGVEIFALEWSFGWTPQSTGVHNVYAGCSESGIFKERIHLGYTPCSPHEVVATIGALRESWPGVSYNLLRRNCAHFSMKLVQSLKVTEFPEWVTTLSSLIAWLTEWVDGPESQAPEDPLRLTATETPPSNVEAGVAAAVSSELDWKEAQEYMLERASDAMQARRRRLHESAARGTGNSERTSLKI